MGNDEGLGVLRWTASIVTSTALGIGLMALAGSALHTTREQALLDSPAASHATVDGGAARCSAPTEASAG